ncbi:MAG: MFS transporter [Actinomycetota bacterium]
MGTEGSIWRNRDVTLLVSGNTVNEIGDWLLELALPLYVFVETESGTTTAAIYLLRLLIGAVCGPLGGRFADTWPLRATLVGTNLLQVAALLPLMAVTTDRIWPVFIVVVLQGLISSVNDPAGFALVPRLVSGEQLLATNSAMSAGQSFARLIGAAVGGVAIEFGGLGWVVAVNGATFAVAALTAGLMSAAADRRPEPREETANPDTSIRAGIAAVRRTPALGALLSIRALSSIVFGGFPVTFIVFVTVTLDGSGADVGLLRANVAIAGLVAAAVIGRHADRIRPEDLMTIGFAGFAALGYGWVNASFFTTALWVYFLGYGLTGFPNTASGVGAQSTAQRISPPEVLGRVGGLMGAVNALAFGIGAIAAGLLLEVTSARAILNGHVTIFVLCSLVSWFFVRRPLRARDALSSSAV